MMNANDIQQKLALLPEGLAESNVRSWKATVEFFEKPVDAMIGEHFPYSNMLGDIAAAVLKSEQAKLFRAGEQAYDLIISTADGQELKLGEPFLNVDIARGFLTIRYDINEPYTAPYKVKEKSNIHLRIMGRAKEEVMTLSQYNVMTALQPMLNLLWDETRGRKNA
jgi:hypothetical protein